MMLTMKTNMRVDSKVNIPTRILKDTAVSYAANIIATKIGMPLPMQVFVHSAITSLDEEHITLEDIKDSIMKKANLTKIPLTLTASFLDLEDDMITSSIEQVTSTMCHDAVTMTVVHYVIKMSLMLLNVFLML